MNSDLIVLIIGTLFGALISSIGYFYQRKTEKKKVLNKSLFSLLEIWSQINRIVNLNPDYILERIKAYINKKYPENKLDENDQTTFILLLKIFKNIFIEKELSKNNESLETLFYQTINEISLYSPVLAYELNKEHSIKHILTWIDEYIKTMFNTLEKNPTPEINSIKQFVQDKLKEKILKETLDSLENDIKKVAWKSSILNRYKVQKLLKEKKKFIIDDKLLESLFSEFGSGIK